MSTQPPSLEPPLHWSHPRDIPGALQRPDAPAVADARRELTAGEFAGEVLRVAGAFAALGVRPGDVVATMLPNRIELVTAMFATWRLGAAVTPINPALTADEAGHQVHDSGARLALVDGDTRPRLAGTPARLVDVRDLPSLAATSPSTRPTRLRPRC